MRFRSGAAPALPPFAADAGPFAALGGQEVGVEGAGVAPAQVVLQPAGQRGVVVTWRRALREEGTIEMLDGLARYLTAQPAS